VRKLLTREEQHLRKQVAGQEIYLIDHAYKRR